MVTISVKDFLQMYGYVQLILIKLTWTNLDIFDCIRPLDITF